MKNFKNSVQYISLILACSAMQLIFMKSSFAQQHILQYKLVRGNDTVGELTVIDDHTPDQRTIQCDLKAEITSFLLNINLRDHKSVVLLNNVLTSATVARSLLNRKAGESVTRLINDIYTDGKKPIAALSIYHKIDYTMAMLYVTEPLDRKFIYSEFHQQVVKINQVGNHIYRIETPEGQVGIYHYKNGMCIKIETITSPASITTLLVNKGISF